MDKLQKDPLIRFRQNIEALQKHGAEVPTEIHLLSYEELPKVIGTIENGDINIALDHGLFYANEDALSFAQAQCEDYTANPERIEVFFKDKHKRTGLTTTDSLNLMHDFLVEQSIPLQQKLQEQDQDGQCLLVLGTGLCLHLNLLIDALPCKDLVLIEPDLSLLGLALHHFDFQPLIELIEKRNGKISLFYHQDTDILARNVKAHFDSWKTPLYDGSYIFTHYQSHAIRFLRENFSRSLASHIGIPKGFWEDEEKMLYNSYCNIKQYTHQWLLNPYGLLRFALPYVPCFIVGSGPSLDKALPILRKLQPHALIFSCGTALGALLKEGVIPDFHCEIENTPGPAAIIGATAKEYPISSIPLLAACTVDPKVPAFFDKRIFYMRDHLSCQYFFADIAPTPMLSPTVTNLALRSAIGFGFHEIYLFGTDLGSRESHDHHAKATQYHQDPRFFEKHPYHRHAVKLPKQQAANLGGIAYTNENFSWAGIFMHSLISDYKNAFHTTKVFNCSDGIAIEGTIPLLPNCVRVDHPKNMLRQKPKNELVQTLLALAEEKPQKSDATYKKDLDTFTHLMQQSDDILSPMLSKPWESRQDILSYWQYVSAYFQKEEQEKPRFGKLLSCFYRGSLATLVGLSLSGERRIIGATHKKKFRAFMQDLTQKALAKNRDNLSSLLALLREK